MEERGNRRTVRVRLRVKVRNTPCLLRINKATDIHSLFDPIQSFCMADDSISAWKNNGQYRGNESKPRMGEGEVKR
jgi:hypothetical protein